MITFRATVRAPNGLVFINDRDSRHTPDVSGTEPYWSIPSCLVLACEIDCEGETKIIVGPIAEVREPAEPLLDKILETPSSVLVLRLVPNIIVYEVATGSSHVRVAAWTNHPTQPTRIVIGLERGA